MPDPVHFRTYREPPKRDYPYLAYLMDAWFHQDYDVVGGPTYQGVIANFVTHVSSVDRERTAEDIRRFLLHFGATDAGLAEAMDLIATEVTVEGWDGLTTRGWLVDVARLISAK